MIDIYFYRLHSVIKNIKPKVGSFSSKYFFCLTPPRTHLKTILGSIIKERFFLARNLLWPIRPARGTAPFAVPVFIIRPADITDVLCSHKNMPTSLNFISTNSSFLHSSSTFPILIRLIFAPFSIDSAVLINLL